MAATKSSGIGTDVQLEQNEETLTAVQQQLQLASLLAVHVNDSESGLRDLQNVSTPRREAEKDLIPDMFVSFISQNLNLNDLQMTKKEYEKHAKANFSFMASLWQPNAGPEELRTICDWNKWVFDLDDQFDDGDLSTNPENAREEIEAMIELQKELVKSPDSVVHSAAHHPLRYVYQTVGQRIFKVCALHCLEGFNLSTSAL
ncbi:hypothetical protein IMSHALPRED_004435 [Imshaugia aleurites]|uniref:Uncharacterized protein n=1 Tax=Imshaugia aleurites TaxID=172621 RepID=A0A8H3F6X9_9LECA|nr:hypothetical protein IMSHALPRED_004435 [Imshaugia aleurites]